MREDDDTPAGYRLRIFADLARLLGGVPSPSGGFRFHRADLPADCDAITVLSAHHLPGLGVTPRFQHRRAFTPGEQRAGALGRFESPAQPPKTV